MSPKIVSRSEWLTARRELLAKEKELSRQRDAISAARRELGMVKIDKTYAFDGPDGRLALRDLFGGKRQLIVYHLMFDPSWEAACKSCSLIADNFEGGSAHLGARDTRLVAVSRAPLAKLEAFKERMGWKFPWVSSHGTDFNADFGVTFTNDDIGKGGYNYGGDFREGEAPGLSAFYRDGDVVFHSYSTYSRGLDLLIGTYNYLDLTALGRDEANLEYGMEWVKLRDQY